MKKPKCPVCGVQGATKPAKKQDYGYCYRHFPSWSWEDSLMFKTKKELVEMLNNYGDQIDDLQNSMEIIMEFCEKRRIKID